MILAPKKKMHKVWRFKTILSVVSSTSLAYTRPCLKETKQIFKKAINKENVLRV